MDSLRLAAYKKKFGNELLFFIFYNLYIYNKNTMKNYKILTVETGKMIHNFTADTDAAAIHSFNVWLDDLCLLHGENMRIEYVLKEEIDEWSERTVAGGI